MGDSNKLSNRLESIINLNPNVTSGKLLHLHQLVAQNINSTDQDPLDIAARSMFTKSTLELTVIMCAYSPLVVLSLCINIVVCYVLFKTRRMRTVTNCFTTNLSVSDILLTLLNIPFNVIRNTTEEWVFGHVICGCTNFILNVSVYASTFTMTAIALERYRVIMCPLRPRISFCTASVTITVIWLLGILMSLPFAIFSKVTNVRFLLYDTLRCRVEYPQPQQTYERYIILTTFICQYLVPLLLTAIVYTHIVYKLWSREVIGQSIERQQVSHLKSRKRSIRMLVVVVALFSICWLPLNLYHILLNFHPDRKSFVPKSNVYLSFHWLAMSSVCYNPLVYCWTKGAFRAELRKRVMWIVKSCLCVRKKKTEASKAMRLDSAQRSIRKEYSAMSARSGSSKKAVESNGISRSGNKLNVNSGQVDSNVNRSRDWKPCLQNSLAKRSSTDDNSSSRLDPSYSENSQYNQWV